MPAHPVGHIKPNPPIKGHTLIGEGAPDFCEHGRIYGGRGLPVPCCPTFFKPVTGRSKCACGVVAPTPGKAAAGKRWHREHKATIRAALTEGTTP